MLRQLDPNLWVLDKPFKMFGVDMGGRMTVVRLADGGLWLHSPVKLDPEDRAALDRLGPVRHIVAPNQMHHLYVAPVKSVYPEAQVYLAPGLAEKVPSLPAGQVLGSEAPAAWAGQIQQLVVGGAPKLNEVVFRAGRTLIVTDLLFNLVHAPSLVGRILFTLNGALGGPRATQVLRSLFKDRAAVRGGIEALLAWDFERIVVTHGEVIESGGREALRSAYAFLLGA